MESWTRVPDFYQQGAVKDNSSIDGAINETLKFNLLKFSCPQLNIKMTVTHQFY